MQELLKFILGLVVVAALVAGVLRILIFKVVRVETNDMVPTLVSGDWIAVYTGGDITHGDVMVCRHPKDPARWIVLRTIGLPDDVLSMGGNRLRINDDPIHHEVEGTFKYYDQGDRGEPFEYELRMERETFFGRVYYVGTRADSQRSEFPKVKVEKGLYLIGDNRNLGEDSREFGEVEPADCIGQAFFVLWATEPNGDLLPGERRFTLID